MLQISLSGMAGPEEADAGDAAGSGGEAGCRVLVGDAAESEDGDGVGEGAGGAEEIEAGAGEGFAGGEGFAEDGAEEDEAGWVAGGGGDLFERVAGLADDGGGQGGGGIKAPDLGGGQGAGCGGQVDAGSADRDGDVGAGVDQKPGLRAAEGGEEVAGEGGEVFCAEILFSQLKEVYLFGSERTGLAQEGGVEGGGCG